MRTRTFLAVAGAVLLLLVGAGSLYAYDATRDDLIAEGIRVGGVDVGGLRAHQAREKLGEELLRPLRDPIVARYKSRRFTLTAEEARLGVDIERSVSAALQRSRQGNLFERTKRNLSGERVDADLEVRITHDASAVEGLVDRVEDALERAPRDATVKIRPAGVSTTESRTGLEVQASRLRREITAALTSVDGDRTVRVRTKRVAPEVSSDELADRYPAIIIVHRDRFRLTLYKGLKQHKTYKIAVGKAGMDTPAGQYKIENKAENPAWHVPDSEWAGELAGKVIPPDDPRNPIEARWMAIYNGAGIHGTEAIDSLGTAASHGCVRMAIPDVIELYDQVPVGSPVLIV